MTPTQVKAAHLRSRLCGFKRLVDKTRRIIQAAIRDHRQPYVAFSGGKDSTVLLSLVREYAPEIPAVFSDDEWNFPETLEYLATIPGLQRIASRVRHAEWFTSWEHGPAGLPAGTYWMEASQGDGIPAYARMNGFDLAFLGLRKEESGYRKLHLCGRGPIFFCFKHQMIECSPLADWAVADIWAYLISTGTLYNGAYDRMSEIGVDLEYQRVGPFAVERVLGYGQLAIVKRGWPHLFSQFAAKYPQAHQYV